MVALTRHGWPASAARLRPGGIPSRRSRPKSRTAFCRAVDCDQPAEQRRSGRLSANGSASAASSTAWNTPTTCCPMCAAALRTGTIDQGKLQGILTVDFDKLAGWNGLTFFANVFQIHNTGRIRRDYVGGINTIAAIEAVPTTRLSELWLEQKFRRRQGERQGRPARRRHRVLLQRTQHACSCRAIGRPSRRSICRAAARPIRCRRPASG